MVLAMRSLPVVMPQRRHTYMVPSKPNSFGARLRTLRLNKGLTQLQLEALADVGQSTISKYERGETDYPDPEAIGRLERTLDAQAGELLDLAKLDDFNRRSQDLPPGSLVVRPDDPDLLRDVKAFVSFDGDLRRRLLNAARLKRRKPKESVARDERDNDSAASA